MPGVEVVLAMNDDVIDELRGFAAEVWAKLGRGRERCLTTWLSLLNMRLSNGALPAKGC